MASPVELGAPLLWATLLIPLAATGLASAIPGWRGSGRAQALAAAVSWLIDLGVVSWLAAKYWPWGCYDPAYLSTGWLGTFTLVLDSYAVPFALAVPLVMLAVSLYSWPYMEHRFEELGGGSFAVYFLLLQLFGIGMLGAVYSTNAILFYLFLELTLIPSFLLIALYGYGDRVKVALLYLIWTHIGALLYLIGVLLAGFSAGFDTFVPGIGYASPANLAMIGAFILVLVGLAVKMALAGLHFWLPYAHAEAPTPISAVLSPLLIGLGGYAMGRFLLYYFGGLVKWLSPILVAWGIGTAIYGGLLVLKQTDIKRYLAYSSVSQMGYLMTGLAVANAWGLAAMAIHYLAHAIGKALLFAVAGIIIVTTHTRDIGRLGGLAQALPAATMLAIAGIMNLTGIPPAIALWSEFLLAKGIVAFAGPSVRLAYLVAALVVVIVISTAYSFLLYKRVFTGKLRVHVHYSKLVRVMELAMMVLVVASVILFFIPEFLVKPIVLYATHVAGLR